ncbi:hypothetical protein DERP_006328 [Dermatophagoides pteronyssinus]|uniref:Uncharacterized protein n=1 Tax=Dermatophagoides pteronyssinus TaxID=6956 RepID=A0ABQ8IY61_DERPT|nr:hypothetical protein DERP_006328 [Dermatophagoides pteronyssinus]
MEKANTHTIRLKNIVKRCNHLRQTSSLTPLLSKHCIDKAPYLVNILDRYKVKLWINYVSIQ